MNTDMIKRYIDSKKRLVEGLGLPAVVRKEAEEGGCGVVGFCCTEPVPGRCIQEPSKQMHNRGNGKGGGVAAVGFVPEQLGVSREVLDEYYMLHVAFLKPEVRQELEKKFITPNFDVTASGMLETVDDWKSVPGLEVKPPDVCRYFVRVKPKVLDSFITENKLEGLDRCDIEDEFINQNSFKLNQEYYASLGEQKAFVLSHGRNIMILKVVGYAEAITQYYKIDDLSAHVWIAHQRYPTKGREWHPGGAHLRGPTRRQARHSRHYDGTCEPAARRFRYDPVARSGHLQHDLVWRQGQRRSDEHRPAICHRRDRGGRILR